MMFLFLAIVEVIIIHISTGVQLESISGPCDDLYDQVSKHLFSAPPQQQSTTGTSIDGGPTADASVSVRVHVVEAVFTPAEVASKLNRWLEKQRQAKLSLQDVWLEKTGINLVNDVKFRIYRPRSDTMANVNLSNVERIEELNEMTWQTLGDAASIVVRQQTSGPNATNISSYQHDINDTGLCGKHLQQTLHYKIKSQKRQVISIAPTGCIHTRAEISNIECRQYHQYLLQCLIQARHSRKMDTFHYMYSATISDSIRVHLKLVDLNNPFDDQSNSSFGNDTVFTNTRDNGSFVLKHDGRYEIVLENTGENDVAVNFTFYFEKNTCVYATDFINRWIKSGYLDLSQINVILVGNRMDPLHGHEEYLELANKLKGIVLLKKFVDFSESSQSLWAYIAEALQGTVREPGKLLTIAYYHIAGNFGKFTVIQFWQVSEFV